MTDTIHEMTAYWEGSLLIWNCATCGRKVAVLTTLGMIVVIEPGDASSAHRGGTGGLTIGAVLVEETPGPFEEWVEDVDFSALE